MSNAVSARQGDWMQTLTGRRFYPADPRPEDVDIRDIAHALSLVCRFGGHTRYHYSVAQHSVYCAELAAAQGQNHMVILHALLHDAAEAYVCDIPRPLKRYLTDYAVIEARVMRAIYARFGLASPGARTHDMIKLIDEAVLYAEARTLLDNADWVPPGENAVKVRPMRPSEARAEFMRLWRKYGPKEGQA